jgi:hypothetical protein
MIHERDRHARAEDACFDLGAFRGEGRAELLVERTPQRGTPGERERTSFGPCRSPEPQPRAGTYTEIRDSNMTPAVFKYPPMGREGS